jgi:hypothetical protein
VLPIRNRASVGKTLEKALAGLLGLLLLGAGCGGRTSDSNGAPFRPGIAAIPHAAFDPSWADKIALRARYGAWVELENEHTLDLAVWPSQSAAEHALAQYRAGGANTRPGADRPWPHVVRRVERITNVTLAWYHSPTSADEVAVKGALRFRGATKRGRDYTTFWVIPGTLIDPDATAATAPARYSARLEATDVPGTCLAICPGAVGGPITVAIWSNQNAAKRYIQEYKDVPGFHSIRIRNATLEAADFEAKLTSVDEAVVRNALH